MQNPLFILFPLIMTLFVAPSANAIAPFKKAFEKQYVSSSDNDEFKAAFKKGSCNVCHVKGQKKDWLNPYGLALAKTIPGSAKERLAQAKSAGSEARKAENKALLEDLKKAFKVTEALKSKEGIPFETLFKEHKLPSADGAVSLNAKGEQPEVGAPAE